MIRLKGLQFCSKQRIFDLRRNWSNNDYKIDQLFVHFCSSLFVVFPCVVELRLTYRVTRLTSWCSTIKRKMVVSVTKNFVI